MSNVNKTPTAGDGRYCNVCGFDRCAGQPSCEHVRAQVEENLRGWMSAAPSPSPAVEAWRGLTAKQQGDALTTLRIQIGRAQGFGRDGEVSNLRAAVAALEEVAKR